MIEKNSLETKNRKTKTRDLRPLFSFFAVCFSLVVVMFTVGVSPFGNNSVLVSDLSAQYAPYLATLRNKLMSGGSLSYSFEVGMGKNFTGILAYYISSPLNLLTLLFPVSKISEAIVIIAILKLSFAGAFMTALIDYKFSSKTKMSILFGMMYALSSFSMSFIFNFIWFDGFALLPLVILFTEKFKDDLRKAWKLLLVLILLFVSNYYIAYMVGVFAFFYLIGILEYQSKDPEAKAHSAGKTLGVFILVAICAAMVCAVLLVPAGLDTIRNGDNSSSLSVSMDAGFPLVNLLPHLFINKMKSISENLPFIYSSLAVLELVILFFMNPSIARKLKIRAGLGLGIGILSFVFPILNTAWHLFNEPNWFLYRYSFLFIFGTILIAFYSFLHISSLRNKDFLKMGGLIFALLCIGEAFGGIEKESSMYFQNLIMITLTALCIWGMSKEKWPDSMSNLKKYRKGILVPIVVAEIVFIAPKLTVGALWNDTQSAKSFSAEVSELIELTKDTDDGSGKRTEKAGTLGENIDSLSLSSYTGTKGLGAFCSMANKPMQHFLKQLGYCANFNYTSIEHRNVNLLADSLMGISYVVSDESEIPGLTPVSSSGKYTLFENPYSVGMVFLAEKDAYGFDGYSLEKIAGEKKDEEDLKDKKAEPEKVIEKDYFAFQEDLLSSLTGIGADKVFDARHLTWEVFNAQKSEGRFIKEPLEYDLKKDRLNLENVEEGYTAPTYYLRGSNKSPIILKATMYVKTDGPVYLSVPFLMKSAPVSIYCNGKCIYKEESTSYYSVIVDAGIHGQGELITFEIRCDDDVLACFEPYAAETDLKALFEQTEILKKGISGLSVKDGYVTFSTESSKEQLLITTIPYEKGWSAKVDGKDVEIVPYQDAFICIPLDAGSHDVQLQFDPPGARIGGIISALGVFACAALIFCTRKSGKVKQQRREQE